MRSCTSCLIFFIYCFKLAKKKNLQNGSADIKDLKESVECKLFAFQNPFFLQLNLPLSFRILIQNPPVSQRLFNHRMTIIIHHALYISSNGNKKYSDVCECRRGTRSTIRKWLWHLGKLYKIHDGHPKILTNHLYLLFLLCQKHLNAFLLSRRCKIKCNLVGVILLPNNGC